MKKTHKNSIEEEIFNSFFLLFGNNFNITIDAIKCIQPLEIKIAYRKRALETHPDRARFFGKKENEMVEQFKRVTEAYERLSSYSSNNWDCLKGVSFSGGSGKKASTANKEKSAKGERRGWRFSRNSFFGGRPEADGNNNAGGNSWTGARSNSDYSSGYNPGSRKNSADRPKSGRGQSVHSANTNAKGQGASAMGAGSRHNQSFSSKNNVSGNNAGGTRTSTYFRSGRWGIPQMELLLGQFLYYSGMISWESLIKAIIWQRNQRPLFGQIAYDWNILSHNDIKEILKNRDFKDKFGDYALRHGFITSFQHMAIIGKQHNLQQPIGEFFIENGLISTEDIKEMLIKQRSHNINIRIRKKATA